MMISNTIDLCYRYYSAEPDPRVRMEYGEILRSLLEEEKEMLQKQINGPEIPLVMK